MSRQEVLERERRWALPAAIAAILASPLYIVSVALEQAGDVSTTGLDTERYRAIDAAGAELLGAVVLRGLAFVLLCLPLLYLFRAAKARSERVSGPMVGFAFVGPILLAAQGVIGYVAQRQVASDFVAQAGSGGDVFTLLDDLQDDSAAFDVATNLLFPAILGMLVAMVYVSLQAMRVGLLTRFFGTLGMALGAGMLFIVPAIALLTIMIWFGWLGFVILDRVPKGRPPAWDAGTAIPWPRPGEEQAETPRELGDGNADEPAAEDARSLEITRRVASGQEAKAKTAPMSVREPRAGPRRAGGRELRYRDGPPSKRLAEEMLEIPTGLLLEARERNPALAALDLEGALERLDHAWIDRDGELVHLELHDAQAGAPTVVIAPGLGDHAVA